VATATQALIGSVFEPPSGSNPGGGTGDLAPWPHAPQVQV